MGVASVSGEVRSHIPQGNQARTPQLEKPKRCNKDPAQQAPKKAIHLQK